MAEDVAKVDPDLVARDEEGKPYTVPYEAVNAMLLNEFLSRKQLQPQCNQAARKEWCGNSHDCSGRMSE